MKVNIINIKKELRLKADSKRAKILQRFFKTGPGEYGEGDVFLGITAPEIRKIVKKYKDLSLKDIEKLLRSKIHEERVAALRILVQNFQDNDQQKNIFNFYLKNINYINNWDLVDMSADKIIGEYLLDKFDIKIIYKLAKSKNLWQRRIAIIATFQFIKNNRFEETLKISEMLLDDKHDLIHKAVGWMLREVGKKSLITEEKFLKKHYKKMPRVMLRYAIERFPKRKRKAYLNSKING